MAALGVLAGLLTGGAIGLVLIEVVNRQSFHWSMDVLVPWGSLALFGTALIAAGGAGRRAVGARRRCRSTRCSRCGRIGDARAVLARGAVAC